MTEGSHSSPGRVVAIGASAGGVSALRELVHGLPADLDAAVLIVLHVPASGTSALPSILQRACSLPVRHPHDGDRIHAGEVLCAPPDHHLSVTGGRVLLAHGPRENGYRPSVDVLFRSIAREYGARACGVVLSGSLDDGAAGAAVLARAGGLVLAQDPEEAMSPGMPAATIAAAGLTGGTSLEDVAARIVAWLATPLELDRTPEPTPGRTGSSLGTADSGGPAAAPPVTAAAAPPPAADRVTTAETTPDAPDATDLVDLIEQPDGEQLAVPPAYGCPDCGGGLNRVLDDDVVRFRCRVGHAWSAVSLVARQQQALESALWTALRSVQEQAGLRDLLADRARRRGAESLAATLSQSAADARASAELLLQLIREMADNRPVAEV